MDSSPPKPNPPLRALVVDDEPSVRRALRHAMEGEGWQVELAESGDDAVRSLKNSRPDVVVADKNMPGMNGLELLEHIREGSPEIAYVLITGYGNAESARAALRLDIDGYIEKPFANIFRTLDDIRRYVDRRQTINQFREAKAHFTRATTPTHTLRQVVAWVDLDGPETVRMEDLLAEIGTKIVRAEERDAAELIVTTPDHMAVRQEQHRRALIAVCSPSGTLSELLTFIDGGASAVVDPRVSDDVVRDRLTPLVRMARNRRAPGE